MTHRSTAIAILLVLAAVVVQTTFFVRFQPLGVAPDLVLLVVVAAVRHLPSEPAVLVGFSGGLLADLLGVTPLGLRALVLTVVAFLAVRLQERLEASLLAAAVGVVLLTVLGEGLFAVIGTLFGRALLSDALIMRKLLLVPLYNLVLAPGVFPLTGVALQRRSDRGWVR